jgi:hypothetical protein
MWSYIRKRKAKINRAVFMMLITVHVEL